MTLDLYIPPFAIDLHHCLFQKSSLIAHVKKNKLALRKGLKRPGHEKLGAKQSLWDTHSSHDTEGHI